tara:strand:- start:161 stop:691 length:531 start_codon:yes stop_codon:yes gene_type:complete
MSDTQVETRTLVNNKGQSIDTPYTDKEAFDKLKRRALEQPVGNFTSDLIAKGARYGLSDQQFWWVHKLLLELENPPERPQLMGIWNAYSRAKLAMVSQRDMTCSFTLDDKEDTQLVLSVAGSRSKYAGSIWVRIPLDDIYLGRITDGLFYRAAACSDEMFDAISLIDEKATSKFPW